MISILLPVFNGEQFIHRAVESVLAQDTDERELLLIDDGSNDKTPEIIAACAQNDKHIRVITLPHRGIVHALNEGLKLAKGEFIARMDADDMMYPERLSKQKQFLETHPGTGLVSCCVEHGGDAATQEGYAAYITWINSLMTHEQISLNRFVESPLAHPSVMFRKKLADQYGGYREGDFPEDYELWLRWLEAGVVMEKIPETLLVWNDPPERLSRTDNRYSPEKFFSIKESYLSRFIKERAGSRKIIAWGAGKLAARRSRFLFDAFDVGGYIDVDPKKNGRIKNGVPVISYQNIPAANEIFIVSFVTNRGKREAVRGYLLQQGFREGDDFILAG